MNICSSFRRVALLALALTAAGLAGTFADTTTTTSPVNPSPTTPAPTTGTEATEGKHHHHHDSVLTEAERTQLKTAKKEALAADPTLASDKETLKEKFKSAKGQGTTGAPDQMAALRTEKQDYETKLRAAELKADPTLGPIFTKLDAAHVGHGKHAASNT